MIALARYLPLVAVGVAGAGLATWVTRSVSTAHVASLERQLSECQLTGQRDAALVAAAANRRLAEIEQGARERTQKAVAALSETARLSAEARIKAALAAAGGDDGPLRTCLSLDAGRQLGGLRRPGTGPADTTGDRDPGVPADPGRLSSEDPGLVAGRGDAR